MEDAGIIGGAPITYHDPLTGATIKCIVIAEKEIGMMKPVYTIHKMEDGSFELRSTVKTNFGGYAVNFVCSGSKDRCETVKRALEAKV